MPKYLKRGLETSAELERCHCWAAGTCRAGWPSASLPSRYPQEDTADSLSGILGKHVLTRLKFLFLEPNASDPLNKEAAEDLRSNREGFKRNVRTSMGGGSIKGENYERVIGR